MEMFKKESTRKFWKDNGYSDKFKTFYKFLSMDGYKNNLIIDYDFGDRIRRAIDNGIPPIITFNWSMFFKFSKYNDKDKPDPVKGDAEQHAVVVSGYSSKGAYIVDSHHECYKYSLKKYRKGRYFVSWESLMAIMGAEGTIIIGYDYRKELEKYELV